MRTTKPFNILSSWLFGAVVCVALNGALGAATNVRVVVPHDNNLLAAARSHCDKPNNTQRLEALEKLVFDVKVNVNVVSIVDGRGALHILARSGSEEALKTLLRRSDLQIGMLVASTGLSALHIAARSNNAEATKWLVRRLRSDSVDRDGATPLHLAIRYRSYNVIRLIAEHGVGEFMT